jgi:hypothetical protein
MMVENRGNTLASCRMHLVDPTGRVEGEFDPPAAGVEPGASTLVRMKVRANHIQWQRHPRTIPFRIDADQPGSPTASAPATFVQAPVVGEHVIGRLVGVGLVIVALGVAWAALVKPAIDDAAQAAVDRAVPTASTTLDTTVDTNPGDTTVTTVPGAAGTDESIVNVPLPVSVPQGQTGTNQYTVPAGKRLRITDIIVQNPRQDQGTLVIAKDTSTLFTYSLNSMFGVDIDQPLRTPIELVAGEQLVVTVTCDGVGDLSGTACSPNVLLSGVLVPN